MRLNISLNLNEIARAVNGQILNNNNDIEIENISTDARENLDGCLFVALKGEVYDGHDFTAQAVENGAVAVIINCGRAMMVNDGRAMRAPTIAVENTSQAFLDLARFYKSKFELDLTVGITGSAGKTTVKEFMHAVLAQAYKARKNIANFNNEVGLPKTIFSLQADERVLVLEMGMNSFGEISRLSRTAEPDICVINNIGTAHIENLGTREGIKKAKFEILEGMSENASIILNADDALLYAEKNKTGKREYYFGIDNKNADFIAEDISYDYEKNESYFKISGTSFKIPAVGVHNILNAMPAYMTGKLCGISDELIQAGFNNFENAKMRQNIYEYNGIIIIDDCYNSNKEAVLAAFDVLCGIAEKTGGYKIAVLADILECGDHAEEIHREIVDAALEKKIFLYLYGENMRSALENLFNKNRSLYPCYWYEKDKIANMLYEAIDKGDVILFKASRGMAMETVLEDFKNMF